MPTVTMLATSQMPVIRPSENNVKQSPLIAKTSKRLSPKEEMARRAAKIDEYRREVEKRMRNSAPVKVLAPSNSTQKPISVPVKIGRFTIEDVIEDPHTQSITVTYRGGNYKVHTGSRGGKYILVNDKKVYIKH